MVTQKIREDFQKSIDELEAAMTKPLRQVNRSDDDSFKKAFNQTAKELRKSGEQVVLKKAMQVAERGDFDFHEVEKIASRLQKGEKIPGDFLRTIGINVPGKPTRREAIYTMQKALSAGLISHLEFGRGEDGLNKGVESPETILEALKTRSNNKGEGERLAKSEAGGGERSPGVKSRLEKSQSVDLAILFNDHLTGEQETFLRQFQSIGPGMASLIAKSCNQR